MRTAARLFATLAVASLAAVGCKDAIGLTEYTFVDDSQLAGQGGGAGASGAAGASGGSAKCGAVPPTPPQALVTACVFGTGCAPFGSTTLSACISNSSFDTIGGLGCLKSASTCNAVRDCTGQGLVASSTCASSGHWTCAGDVATYCDASVSFEYDCSRVGATCDADAAAANGVEALPCALAGETCTTDVGRCDGDTLVDCKGGKAFGVKCSLQSGAHCKARVDGKAGFACVFGSDSCPADLAPGVGRCKDASVAEFCNVYATPLSFDCSTAGLDCVADAKSFHCLAPGCTIADIAATPCTESCAGNTASVCVGGLPYAIDCSLPMYGSGTCVPGMLGSATTAHCRPSP